jgi:hypothetical protein
MLTIHSDSTDMCRMAVLCMGTARDEIGHAGNPASI